ncbi:MAG: glycosyltransferase family 1 protein, partial [Zetaproteobacteria bacterium]
MLHIVEPTLINRAGHCWGLAKMLAEARPDAEATLWVGKKADASLAPAPRWHIRPYFIRRIRRLQYAALMARLLSQGALVFTPTASRSELAAYAALPEAVRRRGRAVFYIHQTRLDARGRRKMRFIAPRLRHAMVLTTHAELAQAWRENGAANVLHVPYPIPLRARFSEAPFRRFVVPGIAREDKGFALLAEIVRRLAQVPSPPPFWIQAAPNHHGEYSPAIRNILAEMEACAWNGCVIARKALDEDAYHAQFSGGICLQPYDPEAYRAKITSVALDALAAGCPIIASRGLWSAEIVHRFGCGAVLDARDADAWVAAILEAPKHYEAWRKCAHQAAQT